ncbi:serine hydrolase [Tellurirhabdus bombi]|uniref:serine hydrolase n=1 Tax=Tellurirhabdus bombi TaxID=2907205 RepID=UPI001F438F09|nr:serine hydrolase [Tellurirhabdus bombi]
MILRFLTITFLFYYAFTSLQAQPAAIGSTKEDPKLARQLEDLLKGFRGNAGVYVRNLKTGRTVAIQADSLFPTASTIKVPIMCGVFDKLHKGELSYHKELVYRDSLRYDNEIVGSLKDSTKIPLSYVMMLMETISDNTGSLWLQALAGGGTKINEWLETNGFHHIRVNSRTPGREANRKQYGWGQTSPRDLAELLVYIRQGKAISPDVSDRMYRNLTRQFWDGGGLSQLPPEIKVGTKNGAVDQSKSEVVLVHAPHGEYVYCVMTSNQVDQRWERSNEGSELLRKVGALLWHYFEPKSSWKPVEGYEKW